MYSERRLRKVLVASIVSLSVFWGSFSLVSAQEYWTPSAGWSSAPDSTIAPYWGNTSILEYKDSYTHHLKPMARFHFNQSAINNIKDDGQWYDYYYTFYKVVGYADNYFEHSSTMSWYDSVSGEYQSTGRAGAYQWHYGRWYTPQF